MYIQKLKRSLKGALGWFIIFLIGIPFVMFGVNSYVAPNPQQQDLMKIGEVGFNRQQILKEIQIQRAKILKTFGERKLPESFDDDRIFQMAINDTIANQMMLQYAADHSMIIGDKQLIEYIKKLPDLQGEEGFDIQKLNTMVVEQGLTLAEAEERYRASLIRGQLEDSFRYSYLNVTDTNELYNLIQGHHRDIAVYSLPRDYYLSKAEISEEDVSTYYEENTTQLQTSEKLAVEYIVLTREKLLPEIVVSEEDLQARWQQRQGLNQDTEKRKARHILLKLSEDASVEQSSEAFKKLNDLRKQALEGASFADLAKAHSQDQGSATSGGDLGEVERGVMVKPFEEALFRLKEGEISEIVTTQFGAHLIYLEEIIVEKLGEYEEYVEELRLEAAEEKSFDYYETKIEELTAARDKSPEDLEGIAGQFQLDIQTTTLAERGELPEPLSGLDDQLFVEDFLTTEGRVSPALSLSDDRMALARVLTYEPQRALTLDEAKEQITQTLKENYAREQREALAQKITEQVDAVMTYAQLKDLDLEPLLLKEYSEVSRQDRKGLTSAELEVIFGIRHPSFQPNSDDSTATTAEAVTAEATTAEATTAEATTAEEAGLAQAEQAETSAPKEEEPQSTPESDAELATVETSSEQSPLEAEPEKAEESYPEFAYEVVNDTDFRLYIAHNFKSATEEDLRTGLERVGQQTNYRQESSMLASLYDYLQERIEVDLSGLQEPQ